MFTRPTFGIVPARILALLICLLSFAGCDSKQQSTPSAGGEAPAPQATQPPAPPPADQVHLTFTYGSEKRAWINDVTKAFNDSGVKTSAGKVVFVEAFAQGSGECIDDILSERRQADLTSPASLAFVKLGNADSRAKTGQDLLGPTENLVLSPVVIGMWKPMAEALGWGTKPVGWAEVLALAKNQSGWAAYGHPEWGRFKFGHTHPEFSNSGLISTFAIVYAATGKTAGLTLDDLKDPRTGQFLGEIEQAVSHYGSSTGFFADKMVANGPSYLNAAVVYESVVIDGNQQHKDSLPFPLVAVYPKEGTFWSDHPVGIVQRPWVTDEKKEAAKIYIDYLLARPQQQKALAYGFRPADPAIPLADPISTASGVDPKEPKTTLEVPPPDVMHGIIQLWHQQKKKANIVLVFDTSGSMNEQAKLVNARQGAMQLVSMLGDDDSLSLLPFSDQMRWAGQALSMKTDRSRAQSTLGSLIAEGGTRLYDSVDAGYQYLLDNPRPDRISAVVVLTDGQDNQSRTQLSQLLGKIRSDEEHRPIRIFTIGYGGDADDKVLQSIAGATQAKYYKGTPQNIREVFKEIATFF